MNNLLDSIDGYTDQSASYGDALPPATSNCRASVDICSISPLPEKKQELTVETKPSQMKIYNEHLPPHPPPLPPTSQNLRRSSADFRLFSPLCDKKGELVSDVQVSEAKKDLLSKDIMIFVFMLHKMYRSTHTQI